MKSKSEQKKSVKEEFDYTRKFIIIGDSGVGKSSLLLRYTKGEFKDNYLMTIGISYVWKIVEVDGTKLKLQIWDTAGQEKYRTITRNYYRETHGAIISFGIDSRASYASVHSWIDDLTAETKDDIQIMLVGTKKDLQDERQVSYQEAYELAQKNGMPYMQCSAKNDDSVGEVFTTLAKMVKENTDVKIKKKKSDNNPDNNRIKILGYGKNIRSRCCKGD